MLVLTRRINEKLIIGGVGVEQRNADAQRVAHAGHPLAAHLLFAP